MGPTHGVQPAAKAMPRSIALIGPPKRDLSAFFWAPGSDRRYSPRKNGMKSNMAFRPRTITSAPAIRLIHSVAELPTYFMPPPKTMARAVNTAAKPATKNRVRTRRAARMPFRGPAAPDRDKPRVEADSPEIKERYTGIRGSTQGLRKERSPAARDAKNVITSYSIHYTKLYEVNDGCSEYLHNKVFRWVYIKLAV